TLTTLAVSVCFLSLSHTLCSFLSLSFISLSFFFFFNDTATTEIYTLSLHDALPICSCASRRPSAARRNGRPRARRSSSSPGSSRSEEHTSELQSLAYLVCRLLLEKKKKHIRHPHIVRIHHPLRTLLSHLIVKCSSHL